MSEPEEQIDEVAELRAANERARRIYLAMLCVCLLVNLAGAWWLGSKQKELRRRAFETGCLAGVNAGIEVYQRRLLGQMTDAEAARAADVCLDYVRTNRPELWRIGHE